MDFCNVTDSCNDNFNKKTTKFWRNLKKKGKRREGLRPFPRDIVDGITTLDLESDDQPS